MLRVEIVGRVHLVAAQIFEHRSAEPVAARLGDDADLPACAGAELGWITAGFDAKLLNVLQTRLEFEETQVFAVRDARCGVDDPGRVDAVILDDILLDGSAGEANVYSVGFNPGTTKKPS